jgi:hypothetical protein
MASKKSCIDLGDELLAEIVEVVRRSARDEPDKAKSLVRAGKIGEMYLGMLANNDLYEALSCPSPSPPSPEET